jgi:hypothetical protein
MSFTDDFNTCMSSSGLPTPIQVFDSVSDALEFLHQLHTAWETAGGEADMTLAALAAAGAATGIDEGVLAISCCGWHGHGVILPGCMFWLYCQSMAIYRYELVGFPRQC